MKSRIFVLGIAVAVIVFAEIILLGAPSRINLAQHPSAATPTPAPLIEVREGRTFGESAPLVPGHESHTTDVLPIPDENLAPYFASENNEEFAANEHSILISSKVELATYEVNADEDNLQQSDREREREQERQREQRLERTRDRELDDVDEDEEHEEEEGEEMPPNSVAQGNRRGAPTTEQMWAVPAGSAAVEQTTMGTKDAPKIIASFDGLGAGFEGPQGRGRGGNPSDNSLAVGPDHVVVTVNSTMAVFTKKGKKYNESGKPLYGPVNTNNVFRGCEICGDINNGDAVVRYDQLADRWLIVMPIFSRLPYREDQPPAGKGGDPAEWSQITNKDQPGPAIALFQPPTLTAEEREAAEEAAAARRAARRGARGAGGQRRGRGEGGPPPGPYAMCYAISTGPDPLGTYYRYHFVRPLFPDYPRPAVWPDGYYNPSSTGDNRISDTVASQKHACVVERQAMLEGKPAREQCLIIENVNFLNNADLDGKELPPPGAPNIMMASGGTQLDGDLDDDGIYYWKMHVDWNDPTKTKAEGPVKIDVAPYNYMSGGQLSRGGGVPQKGSETRLDTQGDKIMSRLVYRRIGNQESIVAVHSINSTGGGGGVRWYEFRIDDPAGKRDMKLQQQGTYMPAPAGTFRWMASPAMDKFGNIGIGYSFGGKDYFPGQRFTGRQPSDPLGQMTLKEAVLAEGQAAQEPATRWQDYVATAVDPDDDCTIWYVGDYIKEGNRTYSSRIGAFRMPGCGD